MRSRQAFKNLAASLILQGIVFLSGIILPRFFLEAYGSQVNGLVTSVNQFLMYLGLVESGVGTASVVALYGPLAGERTKDINSILSATKRFYSKISWIFLGMLFLLAGIFPVLIRNQLPAGMVRSLVLVLGASTFINFYFIGKYKVYLTAKQEGYILSIIEAVGTLLNMIVSILLIYLNCNVVVVKTTATVVFMMRFFAIKYYMDKRYSGLDYQEEPDYSALSQRRPALLHQIVGLIVNNTDVALMTLMMGGKSLLEVSVYGIFNMVAYAINMMLNSFSNGLTAGFGEIISKNEKAALKASFLSYEYLYYIVLFVICSCLGILLLPFVSVYTINMSDTNYFRPVIACLFTIMVFLQNVRIPGLTIICAAGHFKETQKQAVAEAVINLVVSIALIKSLGMAGVLIGTICSYGYRSTDIIRYNQKYLVEDTGKKTYHRIGRNLAACLVLILIGIRMVPQRMESFVIWFEYACAVGIVSLGVILGVNYLLEPQSFKELLIRMKGAIGRN